MRKAEHQQTREHRHQPMQQPGNSGLAIQRLSSQAAALSDIETRSPLALNQTRVAQQIDASQRVTSQRRAFAALTTSPRNLAQRRAALTLSQGSAAQQAKLGQPLQRVEDEEPVQGRFAPLQRVEEEQPIQGRLLPVQRAQEEEPIQGKFSPAQRVEDEEPVQGRFAVTQRIEEEDPVQGRFATQRAAEEETLQARTRPEAVQRKDSTSSASGLPDNLRHGIESLSGMAMDHVKVHYNSPQPAQLNAHAFAQGSDIHIAPGQERHLPHEAWHVVQQAQGRVQPTTQMKAGVAINDDAGLESEADAMGAKALSTPAPAQQLQTANSGDRQTAQRVDAAPEVIAKFREDLKWGDKTSEGLVMAVKPPLAKIQKPNGKQIWFSIDELKPKDGSAPIVAPSAPAAKPYHYAVTMNFEEPAKKAEAATQTPGKVDDGKTPENTNEVEVKPHPAVPAEQGSLLKRMGSKIIEWAKSIGSAISNIKNAIGKLMDKNALFEAGSITQTVGGIISGVAAGFMNTITLFISPLKAAYSAVTGMKTKWHQWGAYQEMAKTGLDEAVYGEKKAKHGFFSMVINFSLALIDFLANLLTLIPGAQIVGGPMKVLSWIASGVRSLATGIFKRWFSTDKKTKNSESLIQKAMEKPDNNPSAELVYKLKLESFEKGPESKKQDEAADGEEKGSAAQEPEAKEEGGWFSKVVSWFSGAKEKASDLADKAGNFIKGRGWKKDLTYLEANDGKRPQSGKDVHQGLKKLKEKGGEEALQPIKDEVKESMTGLTAGT